MNDEIIIRARCSEEEKKDLLKIVVIMTAIAEKTKRDGFLALEDLKEADEFPFLKIAIHLILKGFEVKNIEIILENIIYAESQPGKVLLEKILIFEAIKMMFYGWSGNYMKKTLLRVLGETLFYNYVHSEDLNNKISRMVYRIAHKLNGDDIASEALGEKVLEWMEGSSTYAKLYYAMNNLLKSQAFLTPIASIYLLYESKEVFNEWIDSGTEKILKCIDERLLSKIAEITKRTDFIEVRTDIRGKITSLVYDGYIDFEKNAESAMGRVILSPVVQAEFKTASDLKMRICEFIKTLISRIDEKHIDFDFQVCKESLIKTVAEGKQIE